MKQEIASASPGSKRISRQLEGFPDFVEKSMAEWEVPGLAVAVVKDGEVIYAGGFGLRDVEKRLPVTPRTLFAIGSCTKSFTATAVGMLVDDGKLDLDTPVIDYLPDFRLHDDHATLHATPRDILCHRTGLPRYDSLPLFSSLSRSELYNRLRYLELNAGFRDTFQYNSLMYMVAGILVGRLSGGSWEEFVAERIFEPLGMANSNFSVDDSQTADDFSLPYAVSDGKPVKLSFRNIDSMGPAGSINSSAEEMAGWLLLHLGGGRIGKERLVSEESLEQMHGPQMVIRDPIMANLMQTSLAGLGWFISQHRGHRLIEHSGNIDGFSALASFMPQEKIGVVVLTTTLNMLTNAVAHNIYDRLLSLDETDWNAFFKRLLAKAVGESKCAVFAKNDETTREPNTQPSLPLADYAGEYEHLAYGGIEVKLDGDKLVGKYSGNRFALEHFHFNVFKIKGSALGGLKVRFHLDINGRIKCLSIPLEPSVAAIVFIRLDHQG